tara:strand:+ start:1945 stop:2424 length:480 start_codon:yes stop_codon:yes gene_type:complete
VHSNTYTKIFKIVNNTKKIVGPNFKKDFEAECTDSYSSKENYGYSALEFILIRGGIATQKNWQHDSIFNFAPNMKIDWKVIREDTGNASVSNATKNRDSTHYGFIKMKGDPFKLGSLLEFELVELQEKDYVWNNPHRKFTEYFLYKPKNNRLQLNEFML